MDKVDPYKHQEKYLRWKENSNKGFSDINKFNSDLILQYIRDMETGINVSTASKKGSRSYIRLNSLRERIAFLIRSFEEKFNLGKITEISEERLFAFFSDMRNGIILKENGQPFKSTRDYVKDFKAFWHWHQKVNRKKGVEILDLTTDLDTSKEKPKWVYLTEEQVKQLCTSARFEYKVLFMFLFDTGIRAPTEMMNVKVSDFYNDFKELNIRDEISKTFGKYVFNS